MVSCFVCCLLLYTSYIGVNVLYDISHKTTAGFVNTEIFKPERFKGETTTFKGEIYAYILFSKLFLFLFLIFKYIPEEGYMSTLMVYRL